MSWPRSPRGSVGLASSLALLVALTSTGCRPRGPASRACAEFPPCPAVAPAPPVLPFERPEHLVPEHWLTRVSAPELALLDPAHLEAHNRRVEQLSKGGWPLGRWDLLSPALPPRDLARYFPEQWRRLAEAIAAGRRVQADGRPPRAALLEELRAELASAEPTDELRVAFRSSPLRCYPTAEPLYEKAGDTDFDQLQCAQLRFGEPVRVFRRGRRFVYAWSTYAEGWVDPTALTPPLGRDQLEQYLRPRERAVVHEDRTAVFSAGSSPVLLGAAGLGLSLPLLGTEAQQLRVLAPAPSGLVEAHLPARAASAELPPFSRAALYRAAFRLLHTPYGWGGTGNHRDCSRLLMDLFATFGLRLPRNSRQQALSGPRQIDVARLDPAAKVAAIEAANERGVVLLYLPGHIMLYLGREGGELFAFHQFSGYLVPCPGGGETMVRVNRAAVTSLSLGRGGSRRSFLERITRLVVFGGLPSATVQPSQARLVPRPGPGASWVR
ncbi:MAG: SH3 domain-containing protein [Deltaproteobacteria bacterium]|nr:SH3 domain-containing protein [Deltaproteobacteria bacterium]